MTVRTTTKTVTFRKPFALDGLDEELPPGEYAVETDEERIEDLSFPVWRRILTVIRLRGEMPHPDRLRALTVDPQALDAALERDRTRAVPDRSRTEEISP